MYPLVSPGRIPMRIRVGITGHLVVEDPEAVREDVVRAVEKLVALIAPSSSDTRIVFTAVSTLSEGADRIFANTLLDNDSGQLQVVLPLAPEEYARDFTSAESLREFDALLGTASSTIQIPPQESRDAAYAAAGDAVLESCDLLVTVWDGRPARGLGGTAQIVAEALSRRVPIAYVQAGGGTLVVDLGEGQPAEAFHSTGVSRGPVAGRDRAALPIERLRESFAELDRYNHSLRSRREVDRTELLFPEMPCGRELRTWLVPCFALADQLAVTLRRRHFWLIRSEFLASAAAITAVAFVSFFAPESPRWALAEVVFLTVVVAVVIVGRSQGLPGRWLTSRLLAERFRSAYFLKAVGLGQPHTARLELSDLADKRGEWIRRAFEGVWAEYPRVTIKESDVDALRNALSMAWIARQAEYYAEKSRNYRSWNRFATLATLSLFTLTAVAGICHAFELIAGADKFLIFVSITLPAFGTAIAGITAHREFRRHAIAYDALTDQLSAVKNLVEAATTIEQLQAAATQADDVMLGENRSWMGAMRFHEFEIAP
jgi:hypothetical protein